MNHAGALVRFEHEALGGLGGVGQSPQRWRRRLEQMGKEPGAIVLSLGNSARHSAEFEAFWLPVRGILMATDWRRLRKASPGVDAATTTDSISKAAARPGLMAPGLRESLRFGGGGTGPFIAAVASKVAMLQ